MNLSGNIKNVISFLLDLKNSGNNFRIIALKQVEAARLVKDKDKDLLNLLDINESEAFKKSDELRDVDLIKEIYNDPLISNYILKRIFIFGKLYFSILDNNDVVESKLNKSKIFKEIKSMDDLDDLLVNSLYHYVLKRGFNQVSGYEFEQLNFNSLTEKEKRVFNGNFFYKESVYDYIKKNNNKIPECVTLSASDLKIFSEIYGNKDVINIIEKNAANKFSVNEDIIDSIEAVFVDMEMTRENQKRLVKVLQRTKSVSAKDSRGRVTKLAAKIDDEFFNVLLKDFPTLKAQVEDIPYTKQILENFDETTSFICVKWDKNTLLEKTSLDRVTKELFHKKRVEIVKMCACLGDVKLEMSNNMGNGLEYFVLNTSENPSFNLKMFKENLGLILNEYFTNYSFRECFLNMHKVKSFELALDILESKKISFKMKEDLQSNGVQSKPSMLKLKKF